MLSASEQSADSEVAPHVWWLCSDWGLYRSSEPRFFLDCDFTRKLVFMPYQIPFAPPRGGKLKR
jgi:hypothetical protein